MMKKLADGFLRSHAKASPVTMAQKALRDVSWRCTRCFAVCKERERKVTSVRKDTKSNASQSRCVWDDVSCDEARESLSASDVIGYSMVELPEVINTLELPQIQYVDRVVDLPAGHGRRRLLSHERLVCPPEACEATVILKEKVALKSWDVIDATSMHKAVEKSP